MLRGVVERREDHGEVERLLMSHAVGNRALYWVSVYRVGGVLIDSGCSWGRPVLERFLREQPVDTVLTTHEHEDHVGNHEVIDADMLAPARAVELLHEGPPRLPAYRWVTWGAHGTAPRVRALPGARVRTAGGRGFEVRPTPGHSADHVVYLDQDSASVFAGDAYLGRLRACRAKEDVPVQMASLRRIAELDPAVLYPAHGAVLQRPREKLLEVAEHFDTLGRKARSLADKGRSARRIRQDLLGSEPALHYVSLGAFSAQHIIESLLRGAESASGEPPNSF